MSWTNDEAKTASFGDARLDARMDKVLKGLAEKPGASIPQAMGDWAETHARVPLGTVFLELWKRPEESVRAQRQGKPIEEKESFRWIEGYQAACDVQAQAPDTLVAALADREGDVYELFAEMLEYEPSQRAAWIVRAAQGRLVKDEAARKLTEKLKRAPTLGETRRRRMADPLHSRKGRSAAGRAAAADRNRTDAGRAGRISGTQARRLSRPAADLDRTAEA